MAAPPATSTTTGTWTSQAQEVIAQSSFYSADELVVVKGGSGIVHREKFGPSTGKA